MARLEASICRAETSPASSDLNPKLPKLNSAPFLALWRNFPPRCCFRYFTFFGININFHQTTLFKLFSPVDPNFYSNHPISSLGGSFGIIDICPESVQRQSSFRKPFPPRDFRSAQSSGHFHFDSLYLPTFHRLVNDSFQHSSEGKSFFQLFCDVLGNNHGVFFAVFDFFNFNLEINFLSFEKIILDYFSQIFNSAPPSSNYNSGPCRLDDNPNNAA